MQNIFRMIENEPYYKGYDTREVILFGATNHAASFKKAPEKWSRKEKLAYIEYIHSTTGKHDKWSIEAMLSRGIARESANKAIRHGLMVFKNQNKGV